MEPFTIFAIVLLALAVMLVVTGVKSVPQGSRFTVERFGRFTRCLEPGLHLIVPFVDRIGTRMTVMEQVLDVPEQQAITRDNAVVAVDGVVFFQVLDVVSASYEVNNLEAAILNITMTNLRTVMGSMDLDELLSRRDDINARLLSVVDEATSPWGVKVTRIEIKDIQPPQDLIDAMARQMKAERDKRAAILTAEGDRQAAILRAEGEKQAAILTAEGQREAAFREAEARERLGEAEAKATAMLNEALKSGSTHAINYYIAQKYIEALRAFATSPNQKTMILPVEATGVLGSLAGIGELARELIASARDDGGAGDGGGMAARVPGPWNAPADPA